LTQVTQRAGAPFDPFYADYDQALARGLAVSGEDRLHFARARIAVLGRCLREMGVPPPASVVDLGCGTGAATPFFFEGLGVEQVVGVDASDRCLDTAREKHGSARACFVHLRDFSPAGSEPLVFCNGVFHHVPLAERPALVDLVKATLRAGGLFSLWENNPWNPGARYVMSRIPFDHDAVMLSAREARATVGRGGLEVVRTDYAFVFPRLLKALRVVEPALAKAPLGAQYQVLSRRQA
jgi:SAM-dependent methyltransferase